MDVLAQLPAEMAELLESFSPHAMVGNTTFGFTNYIFYFLIAVTIFLIVCFQFKKKQAESLVPKGRFVNGVEYLIEYIRDDVCKAALGKTWRQHFPFLITIFMFILINNLIGLIPGAHPGTGTIGVTAALGLCSLGYFMYVGAKRMGVLGYILSLAPKGVNPFIAAVIWAIEVFSTFLRLATLAVRLFCNMYAGHIVMGTFAILASMYFMPALESFSASTAAQAGFSLFWGFLLIIIYAVETIVAFIQAYVFTLLSTVYIQLVEAEH